MTWLEVLVEGASDAPTVKEVLVRKFQLVDGEHFRIHPHKGKGTLPANPLSRPDAIIGASEKLAEALGINPKLVAGPTKFQWAMKIAPHLNLDSPKSPSFQNLIDGIAGVLESAP